MTRTQKPRIDREKRTIHAMAAIFCREHHGPGGQALCTDCQELLDYAFCRLDRCPFGERKPTCANCPIHCYKPAMKQRVKEMMKYAGPHMLIWHPMLAIRHLLDGRRKLAEKVTT